MKLLLTIGLFFIYAGTPGKRQLAGLYYNTDGSKFIGISVQLNSDSSFTKILSTCLSTRQAIGKWRFSNDTVYLTSRYQDSFLQMQVEEKPTGRNSTIISFKNGWPEKLVNYILLQFADSSAGYILEGKNYTISIGKRGLKSILLAFGNDFYNKYEVRNTNADSFVITADTIARFANYAFINNEKLLASDKYLYPLNKLNHVDSISPDFPDTSRRIVYRLTKNQ